MDAVTFLGITDTSSFMPHGHCYLWKDYILWPTVIGDSLTGIAYFSIPCVLFYLTRKRKDLVQKNVFILFGLFILACGTTHLLDIWTVWNPAYDIAALVKVITGVLSMGTALVLLYSLPKILLIPSSEMLATANGQLMMEIAERHKAEDSLRHMNEELESRVNQRTTQVIKANRELEKEIEIRKKAEKNLIVRNAELVRINADLDNFVYCASHDLKSPVTNAEGLLTVLKEELASANPEVQFLIEKLEQSVVQMHRTIHELTDVSKVQPSADDEQEKIAFAEVYAEVYNDLSDEINKAEVTIHTHFEEQPEVWFSHKHLKSVMYNLISNAIKYRSPDRAPLISISTSDKGNFIVLSITDNGIGIDLQKHKKKIFSLFKRLNDNVEGSGVGLFIVKRIMGINLGKIEVESKVGEGSTFQAYFPKFNNTNYE